MYKSSSVNKQHWNITSKHCYKMNVLWVHDIILWKLWACVKFGSLLHTADCQALPELLCWVTCVYSMCVCAFSYCGGKQVVFFSHSRRLLKQRAFSINLSISAAVPRTAGWRAGREGGGTYGKHTHMYALTIWVSAERVLWVVTHVAVCVNEFGMRGYRWEKRQSGSRLTDTLLSWMEEVEN